MSAALAPAFPQPERWPHSLPNLGVRQLGRAARCAFCRPRAAHADAATWSYYGGQPICLRHAKEIAGRGEGGRA